MQPFVTLTGLGAGLSYGLYSIIGKPLTARLPAYVIICYILGIGSVVLLAAALPTLGTLVGLSLFAYAVLAASVLVHTALAYVFYTVGLKRVEAGQAAIIASIEPVVAGFLGAVFLAEELTVLKVVGALLVVFGAVLAQVRLRRSPKGKALSPDAAARPR